MIGSKYVGVLKHPGFNFGGGGGGGGGTGQGAQSNYPTGFPEYRQPEQHLSSLVTANQNRFVPTVPSTTASTLVGPNAIRSVYNGYRSTPFISQTPISTPTYSPYPQQKPQQQGINPVVGKGARP